MLKGGRLVWSFSVCFRPATGACPEAIFIHSSQLPNSSASSRYDDDYDEYTHTYASKSYDTDITNGLYYGIGGGVQISGFTVDLMYQANYAKAKIDNGDGTRQEHDLNIHRVTLGVGYAFNF